ncbi:MAG TPA: type I DNA topoisomerase, partial [Candidatus Wolfebacteria bacterium]|nr:type I DNA topoisomerase [Candidatus Wolfebacteria bacterium]
ATVGHVRDLPKSNKKAIDIPGGFIPYYEISKGKEKVVAEIKKLSQKADEVILATDPDREGEAIAWHIKEACGLKKPKRVVFHEITETAIKDAIEHPRNIDENLRKAQESRRVLDRLVGYDLSGLIWKKVRYGLSAGRVQSPALRIIMEREREIKNFIPENYWVISGEFETERKDKIILTCGVQPKDEKETQRIIEAGRANSWKIINIKQSKAKRLPYAPFITSTLQQTASSRLGFSPSRTMSVAQKLYEQGLITYTRTDSVNISKEALSMIYKEIEKSYGKEYLEPRVYKTKSKSAQEAHEAIRPTSAGKKTAGATDEQKKLYKLIWARAIASQMADARMLKTKVSANIITRTNTDKTRTNTENSPYKSVFSPHKSVVMPNFSTVGSITVFPGWLLADVGAQGNEVQIPKLSEGETIKLNNIESHGKQTEPSARYTEASLVKELEKREIGRPSTYASIIKTIIDRGYVEKNGRTLFPTDTGEVVSTFLETNFSQYISDSFTAEMENELDEIAEGKRKYEEMLKNFYIPFAKAVKSKEKIEKITNLGEAGEEFKCPKCGGPMIIKLSKTGKFLSCKEFPKCAGSRKMDGSEIEGPKEIGEICPQCVALSTAGQTGLPGRQAGKLLEREGRFGKFIFCSNYPKCKFIKKTAEEEAKAKTGVACPECLSAGDLPKGDKHGEIVERRGKFGPFFSCSNYPKCVFAIKARPTGEICDICGSLLMEGTKTIPKRCSNKSCLKHNPHKLKK